jgi:hypothetical protein
MAGFYEDGAIEREFTGSQGPATQTYDYTDGPVVEAVDPAVLAQPGPMEHHTTDDEEAPEHYRTGPMSADEEARIAAGGDEFTTTEVKASE